MNSIKRNDPGTFDCFLSCLHFFTYLGAEPINLPRGVLLMEVQLPFSHSYTSGRKFAHVASGANTRKTCAGILLSLAEIV